MGQPELTRFTVAVTYDRQGTPEYVEYYDQEGCGHISRPILLSVPVGDLVLTHLSHAANSHDIHPRVMCPATIKVASDDKLTGGAVLHCVLDKHGDTVKHMFEVG